MGSLHSHLEIKRKNYMAVCTTIYNAQNISLLNTAVIMDFNIICYTITESVGI